MPDLKAPATHGARGRSGLLRRPRRRRRRRHRSLRRARRDRCDRRRLRATAGRDRPGRRRSKSGSPLTHPELGTNVAFTHNVAGGSDIDDGVSEGRSGGQAAHAIINGSRRCRSSRAAVVASYHAGEGIADALDLDPDPASRPDAAARHDRHAENKLRIVAPEVGGGFGAKLNLYAEEALCAHLAMRLGAPVKWIESRRENAASTIHGRDQIGEYEVAVKKDGTILGIKARTIADLGSYLPAPHAGDPDADRPRLDRLLPHTRRARSRSSASTRTRCRPTPIAARAGPRRPT